ncbi:DnaB-like helicase C-terminal domain-containing protein [Anaerosinus sp.]|uniref:DnaB-like helicase C-terminal domain-containing protein n=1 Tax=Selenobaculum sp. TaxID=3074374 RepID=UPI003AB3F7E6
MTGIDLEAERYILSAMIANEDYLTECISKLSSEVFTQKEYKTIFNIILAMYDKNENVNFESVYIQHKNELKKLNISWSNLTEGIHTAPGVRANINKLLEETKVRELLSLSDEIKKQLESDIAVDQIINEVENRIIKTNTSLERQYLSPEEMAKGCLDTLFERLDDNVRQQEIIPFATFSKLNQVFGGLEISELWALSGQTGGGKSIFAMNLACDIGVKQKIPTLFINSELTDKQIQMRVCSYLGGVSYSKIKNGTTTQDEQKAITQRLNNYYDGRLHTLTMPDLQCNKVISEIKKFKRKHDIKFCIIDYIGRMDLMNSDKDDWKVLKSTAQRLKTLALDLKLIILMVVQLNNSGKIAQASYIEHELDTHLSIKKFDDEELKQLERNKLPWNIGLEVKKARNARTGQLLKMYFNGDKMTFTDDYQKAKNYAWVQSRSGGE